MCYSDGTDPSSRVRSKRVVSVRAMSSMALCLESLLIASRPLLSLSFPRKETDMSGHDMRRTMEVMMQISASDA